MDTNTRDLILLSLSGVVTLGSGIVVGDMVVSAFGGESGLRESFRSLVLFLPFVDLVNIISIILGFYLGLLVLLSIDYKKRIQGMLLLVGTIGLVFPILWVEQVMLTAMGPIDFIIALFSLVSTIKIVGGSNLEKLSFNTDAVFSAGILSMGTNRPVEFKKAASLLWGLLAVFIIISFHEAYTSYPQFLFNVGNEIEINTESISEYQIVGSEAAAAFDILVAALFLTSFRYFLQYDTGRQIFVIGPKSAGKSHLLVGLFATAEQQGFIFNPREQASDYLSAKRDLLERGEWVEATEAEVHNMGFTYTSTGKFRRNINIAGLDYPGEYSYYIHQGLELTNEGLQIPSDPIFRSPPVTIGGDIPIGKQIAEQDESTRSNWSHLETNEQNGFEQSYINLMQENEFDPARRTRSGIQTAYIHLVNTILPLVKNADTLIFVYDCQYHVHEESNTFEDEFEEEQSLAFYSRILGTADIDRTIGVATKAGYLIEKYEEDVMREFRYGDPESYKRFRRWINNEMRSGPFGRDINALQLNLFPANIKEDENDDPDLNQTMGMEQLLEKLGR